MSDPFSSSTPQKLSTNRKSKFCIESESFASTPVRPELIEAIKHGAFDKMDSEDSEENKLMFVAELGSSVLSYSKELEEKLQETMVEYEKAQNLIIELQEQNRMMQIRELKTAEATKNLLLKMNSLEHERNENVTKITTLENRLKRKDNETTSLRKQLWDLERKVEEVSVSENQLLNIQSTLEGTHDAEIIKYKRSLTELKKENFELRRILDEEKKIESPVPQSVENSKSETIKSNKDEMNKLIMDLAAAEEKNLQLENELNDIKINYNELNEILLESQQVIESFQNEKYATLSPRSPVMSKSSSKRISLMDESMVLIKTENREVQVNEKDFYFVDATKVHAPQEAVSTEPPIVTVYSDPINSTDKVNVNEKDSNEDKSCQIHEKIIETAETENEKYDSLKTTDTIQVDKESNLHEIDHLDLTIKKSTSFSLMDNVKDLSDALKGVEIDLSKSYVNEASINKCLSTTPLENDSALASASLELDPERLERMKKNILNLNQENNLNDLIGKTELDNIETFGSNSVSFLKSLEFVDGTHDISTVLNLSDSFSNLEPKPLAKKRAPKKFRNFSLQKWKTERPARRVFSQTNQNDSKADPEEYSTSSITSNLHNPITTMNPSAL
ncbi:hypothetical protein ROZALSC1DRAFT_24472, partial [Rozella allomycis CSF55]